MTLRAAQLSLKESCVLDLWQNGDGEIIFTR